MSRTIADKLGQFASEITCHETNDETVAIIEDSFVDTVGVACSGAENGATEGVVSLAKSSNGPATAIGHDTAVSTHTASFLNGIAAHWLELDDGSSAVFGHPSVTLVPSLLAIAEMYAKPGRELIDGYLAGFETMAAIADIVNPDHYEAGWHATGTLGSFGAAAATSRFLKLSEEQTANALCLAASMASGLRANFAGDSKSMHAGHAARSGLTAALLAADGFSASPKAMDSFLEVYTRPGKPRLDSLSNFGDSWYIQTKGINRKLFPCCYYAQSALVSAKELTIEHDIRPEDIDSISIHSSKAARETLTYDTPKTGKESQYSMPHIVSAAIADRSVDLDTFTKQTISRKEIAELRERTTFTADESIPYNSYKTTVEITYDDTVIEKQRAFPPGAADAPLSQSQLKDKFMDCTSDLLPVSEAGRLYEKLSNLRSLDDSALILNEL